MVEVPKTAANTPPAEAPVQIEAAAGTQNSSAQIEPESKGKPIECIVVKTMYTEDGRLLTPDQGFVYQPKADQPFPWPIIRPRDEKLGDKLKEEWDNYSKEKRADLKDRRLMRRSAQGRR